MQLNAETKPPSRDPNRGQLWREYVIPTARSLEGFAWRVAWFAVLVKFLFFK